MKMIQIEVEPNPNVNEEEIRNFMSREKPYIIEKTIYKQKDKEIMIDIVGWENGNPTPAKAIRVEDSGDGEAWLIYGGNQGVRMRKSTEETSKSKKNFSLENPEEWGELYLYYHKDLFENYIKPFLVDDNGGLSENMEHR